MFCSPHIMWGEFFYGYIPVILSDSEGSLQVYLSF